MNLHRIPTAASPDAQPVLAVPSERSDEARALARLPTWPNTTTAPRALFRTLADLPLWADNPECRQLLRAIAVERPERTKVLTSFGPGSFPASFGYRGNNAALLREIWARTFADMMMAMPQPGPRDARGMRDDAAYDEARDGLIRFEREHGCEAVIARALGDAR